jgi:phage virion morphogenesis protein
MDNPINALNKLNNPTQLMKEIAGDMMNAVNQNFEQDGRPKWQELAKSTIKDRERKGKWPGGLLQRSRGLFNSITKSSDSTTAIVGTNKEYAAIHQLGGTIYQAPRSETFQRNRYKKGSKKGSFKKGTQEGKQGFTFKEHWIKIPARPFLQLTDSDLEGIKTRILKWITE